jgi:hypothetical protein
MSNTDTDPSVQPTDSAPPYLNGFASPFAQVGSDLASVARRTRLPPTNAARGMNYAMLDAAAPPGQQGEPQPQQPSADQTQDAARDQEAQRIGPQYPVPQNYIPATAADAGQYGYGNLPTGVTPGDGGWSTNTPSTMQSYRVAQRSSQALGLWGSPAAAPYASAAAGLASPFVFLLNAFSGGRFTHNFDAARLGVLKAQQQQFYNNLEMANENERASLQHYGEIIITGKNEASTTQAMRNAAYAHPGGPDQAMLAALDNGGLARARALLDDRNAHFINNSLSAAQLRKANPGLTAADAYETGGGGGYHRLLPGEQGYQPTPQGQEQGPGQGPQTEGAPANEPPPKSELDDAARQHYGLTDLGIREAHNVLNGDPSQSYQGLGNANPSGRLKVDRYATDMRNRINAIAQEPYTPAAEGMSDPNQKSSPEGKLRRIRAIDPTYAQGIEGILSYQEDPKDISTKTNARYHQMILAQQINKNYRPGNYAIIQKYHDPNSKEGVILRRASSLPMAVTQLVYSLKPMSETDKIPANQLDLFLADHWTGDPKWAQLHTNIRQVATEAVAIEMGTGTPRVTMINEQIKHMVASGSPAQIRAQAIALLRNANAAVVQTNGQFKEETGDPTRNAPGIFKSSMDITDALLRMNPYTGKMPDDAPDVLKGADKIITGKPSWLTKGQDYKPMTREQIDEGKQWIKENQNNPDPQNQKKLQWLRERIGPNW